MQLNILVSAVVFFLSRLSESLSPCFAGDIGPSNASKIVRHFYPGYIISPCNAGAVVYLYHADIVPERLEKG